MSQGNTANLNPVQSKEEAKKRGRNGGIASGKSRRKKARLREALEVLLDSKMESGKTGSEALAWRVFQKALIGDLRSFVVIRDTIGEKPTDGPEEDVYAEDIAPIEVRIVDASKGA